MNKVSSRLSVNMYKYIHTYIHTCIHTYIFFTRALEAQLRYCKYNLNSVTICHHVLLHLFRLGVLLLPPPLLLIPLLPLLLMPLSPLLPLLLLPEQSLHHVTPSCHQVRSTRCTSHFTLDSWWTELTLWRVKQLYVSFFPKGIYICGLPALKLGPEGPRCCQSPTAHSN